jgi:hypothetical protein
MCYTITWTLPQNNFTFLRVIYLQGTNLTTLTFEEHKWQKDRPYYLNKISPQS